MARQCGSTALVGEAEIIATVIAVLSLGVSTYALLVGERRERRRRHERDEDRRDLHLAAAASALAKLEAFAVNSAGPASYEWNAGDYDGHQQRRSLEAAIVSGELEELKRRLGRSDVRKLIDLVLDLIREQLHDVSVLVTTMKHLQQNPDMPREPFIAGASTLAERSKVLRALHDKLERAVGGAG
jgi:hypothetical protein